MKLSLSGRIAEPEHIKDQTALSFEELARLAREIGYQALCIRPAQIPAQAADGDIRQMRQTLDRYGLDASMVSLHTAIAANTTNTHELQRAFGRDLEIAEMLGARLMRVSVKSEEEITWVQRAADQACEHGIRLAQQIHTSSPFETVDGCLAMMARINRLNFGLILEPANLLLCGEAYGPAAIRRLGPHIFNVYVQNLRLDDIGSQSIRTNRGLVRYERLIVGEEGGIDFARFFAGVHAIGYTGFVTSHQPLIPGMAVRDLAAYVYERLRWFVGY
jgi:sugar phosphate isomerase/epimerase